MDVKRRKLIGQISLLKNEVQKSLDEDFKSFHEELNRNGNIQKEEDSTLITLSGLRDILSGEVSKYQIEISDILYWIDEKGYFSEYEKWGQNHFYELDRYLSDQKTKKIFKDIVNAVNKQRIVPFIGAGMSLSSGYPLWGKAIEDILLKIENDINQKHKDSGKKAKDSVTKKDLKEIKRLRELLKDNKYILVADGLFKLNETIVKAYIRETFDSDNEKINGPINLLPKLVNGCIITTNYDGLLEDVFKKNGKPFVDHMHGVKNDNLFMTKLAKGEECLLKLHGHYDNHQTYIFTQQQYDNAYGDNGFDEDSPLTKTSYTNIY